MSETEMILGYRAPSANAAAMLTQALEAAGIRTVQVGGQASGAFGELPADALQVELWIPKDQAQLARTTIEGIQSRERRSQPDWICAQCDETNEGEFEICWSCQEPKQ